MRARKLQSTTVLATVLLAAAWTAADAAAAKARPDLLVRAVSQPPASAQAGDRFAAGVTIVNAGRARSRRSVVRVYLTRDSRDRLPVGTAAIPAARPGTTSRARVAVTIPAGLAAGRYRLVVCADAVRKLREANERNNCRAAKRRLAVATTQGAPAPPGQVPLPGATQLPGALPGGADTTPPPVPVLDAHPPAATASTSAEFRFSSIESGVAFLCSLDAAPAAPCASPQQLAGVAEGEHTFAVRARDAAGLESAPASVRWRVDITPPPPPTIDDKPADPSAQRDASFSFASAEAGVSFRCRLDAQTPAPCTSPVEYASLADGHHAFGVRAVDGVGNESAVAGFGWDVDVPTPDPDDTAPPVDRSVATTLDEAAEFLFTGADPVQTGVDPGTILPRRIAVLRGRAIDRAGDPLAGVEITVLDHPELGRTETRDDGRFDIAVNGGGKLTIEYRKPGFLPAQRTLETPWQDYAWLEDVALVELDPAATDVALGDGAPVQVARGSEVSDGEGTRRATMIFDAGTDAVMELPDGSTQPLDTMTVRATEFTVGDTGREAMPGALPPTSGYTYAVELSVDEALEAGATDVRFDKAVALYVENFLGFPVGGAVPTGYYDREKGTWVASENGRVIKVVSESGGLAGVDTDGDGTADNAGIDAAERQRLAGLYDEGQELWRVEVTHFTPWDCNWPYGPPEDAIGPNGANPGTRGPAPGNQPDCDRGGSTIGCLSRTLGQGVEIVGSEDRLRYTSARAPGNKGSRRVVIPLSGASVPPSLKRIQLDVRVAGQRLERTFAAGPNQSFTFEWDGRDAYGRVLQGEQRVVARIGFVYGTVYYPQPADFARAFARVTRGTGITAVAGRERADIVLWRDWEGRLGGWDASPAGLGGWSLDSHHSYAPASQTLYRGDGSREAATDIARVVTTVAGLGPHGSSGDGGPATEAKLASPHDVTFGPDGSMYIADLGGDRVRKVTPDGTITTVAGRGHCDTQDCFSGDGGPATEAQLRFPHGLAVASDGTLYIADDMNNRIRRVSPGGTITTIAGTGERCVSCDDNGDGGPAVDARVTNPSSVALGQDGGVYFLEQWTNRVRRIAPDGTVTTVAGGGSSSDEGVPATSARFVNPTDIATGPDGSVYVTDWSRHKVRRVRPDGLIETAAGTGRFCNQVSGCFGGDGQQATQADLNTPYGVEVAPDGTIYIADEGNRRIRRVATDGVITTIAGSGAQCTDKGSGLTDCADGGPAGRSTWYLAARVAVGPDGSVYVADRSAAKIRKIAPALPGYSLGESVVASANGDELYVFGLHGRHLETLDALTGGLRRRFAYDGEGRLLTITDRDGGVTAIERDAGGKPAAIVAPGGQRTELAVDANGHLSRVESPAGEAVQLTTSGDGLLSGLQEPGGAAHEFEYDDDGALERDTGPAGTQTLTRTPLARGWSVALTSPLGRTTTFVVERLATGDVRRSATEPGAGTTESVERPDGSLSTTYPSGTRLDVVHGPDPRFGMQAPIVASVKSRTPAGKESTATAHRSAELADEADLLSLVRQTDTITVNGRTASSEYVAATRKLTTSSRHARTTVRTYDGKGRVVGLDPGGGMTPASFAYTSKGRLAQVTQGSRSMTYSYDARGRVISKQDAAGTATYAYDDADRVTTATLPGGRDFHFGYDANGRRKSVTLPSGAVQTFAYSPAGDLTRFTPAASSAYQRTLDADRALSGVTLPGGREQDHTRDGAGRLTGIAYDEAAIGIGTDDAGRVTALSWTPDTGPAQETGFAHDGELVTGSSSTGAAAGTYAYDYDSDFRLTGMKLDGEPKLTLGRDGDGLLTALGPFTFTRGGGAGRVSRISDGTRAADFGYDAFGRMTSRTYTRGGGAVYSIELDYDAADRVTVRRERRGSGPVDTTAYTYDAAGRLETVRVNGQLTESYAYTVDGDRTSRRLPGGGTETAEYGAGGILDRRGEAEYTFDADGFMTARGPAAFAYGARGELLSADTGSEEVTYAYDGAGRRVSRTAGGVETEYLYGNPESAFQVTATRGPGGLTTYYYDEAGHVFAFERGGERYQVATDQSGSATTIANAAGEIVKSVAYDSFGNELSDSAPSFAYPFGFAGGLADDATGLVRFGLRDYDPEAGRWTARDPSLASGLDGNLYSYVANDPVNRSDPAGLFSVGLTAYAGVGGGLKLSFTRDGMSWCGELGFGVGVTAEIDPMADLDKETIGLFGEAKVEVLGLANVKLKAEVTNPCGIGAGPRDGDYDVTFKPEACLAVVCTNFDNVKGKGDPTKVPAFKPEIGLSAKAGTKACAQIKW